jgi:hypothetical protein
MRRGRLYERTQLVAVMTICGACVAAGAVGSPRAGIGALATCAAAWLAAGWRTAIVACVLTAALLTALTATPTDRSHRPTSSSFAKASR